MDFHPYLRAANPGLPRHGLLSPSGRGAGGEGLGLGEGRCNTMPKTPDLLAVVVSPNTAYRLALVQVLQEQRGIFIGADGESLAEVMEENPGLQPALAVVDAKIAEGVSEARRVWPDAWIIYLLDYLSEWETATAHGADACVLKEQGISALLHRILRLSNP